MIKTAGVVFDFYDDGGRLLKDKLGSRVPEFIKSARLLDSETRDGLPDNSFALVMFNGSERLRKYACLDKGNTAASVIYFIENQNKLPKEAQAKGAENLVRACEHFGLVPPGSLVKTSNKSKVLIKGDGAEIVRKSGEKVADVSGTYIMPNSVNPDTIHPRKRKLASVIEDPYVDTTNETLLPVFEENNYPDWAFALTDDEGRSSFPLVTYGQVKEAADFFDEQGGRLHPRTRRTFCVKVAARAEVLGMAVSPEIKKYGGLSYAKDGEFGVAVEQRRQLWRDGHDEAVSMLDALMEKRASMDPNTFAETLAQLDIAVGADKYWGSAIFDPWYSTFSKEAQEEPWRWQNGAEYLTEQELRRLTAEGREVLSQRFGDELATGLAKNPVSIFESLPLDQKRIVARMAQQQGSGL
jgi:hypothetical protein